MSHIQENLTQLLSLIPQNVKLVAVSKTKPLEDIVSAYEIGHRAFGENKVQELVSKHEKLPQDIDWHMIGHLQRNKVKFIAPFVHLLHGVDSFRLLRTINNEAVKCGRIINCLLQVHIAEEDSKFGFSEDEVLSILQSAEFLEMQNINIKGLMGMATYTDDNLQVRNEFKGLKLLFDNIKSHFFANDSNFSDLSIGMSGDYKIAIEEGATIIRVGSIIFGHRKYL